MEGKNMKINYQLCQIARFICIICISAARPVNAHLMEEQHGTLNFLNEDIYMVLSLPIGAFTQLDDDRNGEISMIEFNNHRTVIMNLVRSKVILSHANGTIKLEGVMLSPVISHNVSNHSISQITVMGKFTSKINPKELSLGINLFGKKRNEQSFTITASDKITNRKHVFLLTPKRERMRLFEAQVKN